ncbi:MAG TPA: sugar phosphate isomerase/epimerase [Edaphobacter sp.]|nr:sugar phosphate isomerase/epimerase [Edaphobacter sp.]
MSSRRDFLRLSALAAAAGCALGRTSKAFAAPASSGLIYGLQLFMVRRQAPKDLSGVLRAIRQIGYTQIELYPIVYDHPAPELRRIVQDAGLSSASAHFDYDDFESKIDYGHQLGLEYMVCPMLPKNLWTSTEGFREAAAKFNTWGKLVHDAGMTFAFHNHDYEFKPQGKTTGFAELMQHTDPALVKLEFDLYWLTQGGQDPAAMLTKYANRARLIHLKDRKPNAPTSYDMEATSEHFTEIGKGTVQWPALLSQAHKQGIRYAFVDQDETSEPVLESLKESYTYLRTLKV